MTTYTTHEARRTVPFFDRLFVIGCTAAYVGLMGAVVFALNWN
jgi:hypothetical protein